MDRRDFLKNSTAAALGAGVAATNAAGAQAQEPASTPVSPSVSSNTKTLRVAISWPQNGRGLDDSALRFGQTLSQMSEGRFRLEMTSAVSPTSLNANEADIFFGSSHDLIKLDPAFAYFGGLPGRSAIRPTHLNAWLLAAGGQQLWDHLADGYGFKPFLVGHSGSRGKLWSRQPVTNQQNLKGLRVAAANVLAARTIAALGAEPVTGLSPSELASAMNEGTIDAAEWGGTLSGFACDLHLHTKHCFRPGLTYAGFAAVLAVNSRLWQNATQVDQMIIASAAAQELNTAAAEHLSVSRNLRTALAARFATEFAALPDDITRTANQAAHDVVSDLSDHSAQTRQIAAAYDAFRAGLPRTRVRPASTPVG